MGMLFARVFTEAGIPCDLADARKESICWETAARHDVVLLAVPLDAVEDVCRRLGPHTRPDGLVMDMGSLKKAPVESMLRHSRGEVIGMHPLFGPSVSSFQDRIVFIHNARSEKWIHWLRDFLHRAEARTIETDPVEHDRLMAFAQVMRHMLLTAFGKALMKLEFDTVHDASSAGPWFSVLLGMLQRQCSQSPDLYASIALNNPASADVMDALTQSVTEIRDIILSGSKEDLSDLIGEVSRYVTTGEGSSGKKMGRPVETEQLQRACR